MNQMLEIIQKSVNALTEQEIIEIIDAINLVINTRNGYGTIMIEIRDKHIKLISVASTIKIGK